MCPELDEPWLVSGPFLHELIRAHVRVQTFSTFQRVMLFIWLLSCLLLVSLMASRWPRLPDELWCCNMIVEHCFEQWVFCILSPFTICLPIVWKTHIYPAVWADCNMFREYSNTPYLAGFVGLLVLFQLMVPFKMAFLPHDTFICFFRRERESLTIEDNVGPRVGVQCYFIYFDGAHNLRFFFGIQRQNTSRKSFILRR